MKKIKICFLTICLVLCFAVPVWARTRGNVFDEAKLFTTEQQQDLTEQAQSLSEKLGLDILFLTTTDTQGLSAKEYAAQFFIDGDFGFGEEKSGIVFVIDMKEHDAQMVTSGEAIEIYTDYYISQMWGNVKPYLSDGAYHEGMTVFLADVEKYGLAYQAYLEDPEHTVSEYQVTQKQTKTLLYMGVAVVISLAVAGISVFVMKQGHKNVKPYTDGRAYLKENGMHITNSQDRFLTTHTVRTRIQKDNDDDHSSWGGDSSTFQVDNRDFGGGGGKF